MGQANRLIVNTLSNYALTFISMLASIIMAPIVISRLGTQGYGMVALILAPFGVFETLAGSFGRSIHRFIPISLADPDPRKLNRAFSTGICGYVLIGLLGAGVLSLVSAYLLKSNEASATLAKDGALAMAVLVVWLIFCFPFWGYRKGLESIQRYDILGLVHGSVTLSRMTVVIIVFLCGYGSVTFFIGAHLAGLFVINYICSRYVHRCLPDLKVSPRMVDRTTIWLMGAFAGATILGTIGEILGGVGFRIFVGKALGLAELGDFFAVVTLQLTLGRLTDELTSAFTPTISALDAKGSKTNVAKLMVSGTKMSVIIQAAMSLVPIAVAGPFLSLWLGHEFGRLDTLLRILLLAQVPICLGKTALNVLYGLGYASISGPIQCIRSFTGMVGAFLYVTYFDGGLIGACLFMYGAQAVGGAALLYFGCLKTKVSYRDSFQKGMFVALVAAMAVPFGMLKLVGDDAWWKVAVSAVCGEVVFFTLIFLSRSCTEETRRIFAFLAVIRTGFRTFLKRRTSEGLDDPGAPGR